MNKGKPTIRIEHEGAIAGPHTRVFYIDRDGTETDISEVCTGVSVDLTVGERVTAHLEVMRVDFKTNAELVDVAVREFQNRRGWWRRKRAEVTSFGKTWREYVLR